MKYTQVPILMYHEISEVNNPWCVSPSDFEKQMQYLKEQGYQTITLKELNSGVKEQRETTSKFVAITFDDARKGVYTYAGPILDKLKFKATVYLVPLWLEHNCNLPSENYSEFMSWPELKELVGKGWEIGSHSWSHLNLTTLDQKQLIEELTKMPNSVYNDGERLLFTTYGVEEEYKKER